MKNQSKEIVKLGLTEKDGSGKKPGIVEELITDLKEAIPGIFTELSSAGRLWFRGKSEQEAARAKQILSDVIDRIGRLKLDERDQEHRHQLELAAHTIELKQKQAELYLSSLERATKICKELNEMGVDIDVRGILSGMALRITELNENQPTTPSFPSD